MHLLPGCPGTTARPSSSLACAGKGIQFLQWGKGTQGLSQCTGRPHAVRTPPARVLAQGQWSGANPALRPQLASRVSGHAPAGRPSNQGVSNIFLPCLVPPCNAESSPHGGSIVPTTNWPLSGLCPPKGAAGEPLALGRGQSSGEGAASVGVGALLAVCVPSITNPCQVPSQQSRC